MAMINEDRKAEDEAYQKRVENGRKGGFQKARNKVTKRSNTKQHLVSLSNTTNAHSKTQENTLQDTENEDVVVTLSNTKYYYNGENSDFEKETEKEKLPPTPPIKEKDKEKEKIRVNKFTLTKKSEPTFSEPQQPLEEKPTKESQGKESASGQTLTDTPTTAKPKAPVVSATERIRAREKRDKDFGRELIPYCDIYGKEMIREFYDYWTEPNKSKTQSRKDLQPTWDTAKRLVTWSRKNSKYYGNRNSASNTAASAEEERQRRLAGYAAVAESFTDGSRESQPNVWDMEEFQPDPI